jgi:hypothetical protein
MEHGLNTEMEVQLLHADVTEKVIGASFEATGIKVGLLVNFGRTKVEFKRMVF